MFLFEDRLFLVRLDVFSLVIFRIFLTAWLDVRTLFMWWSPGDVLGEALLINPRSYSQPFARAQRVFQNCFTLVWVSFFFEFVVNDSLNWERKGAFPPHANCYSLSALVLLCLNKSPCGGVWVTLGENRNSFCLCLWAWYVVMNLKSIANTWQHKDDSLHRTMSPPPPGTQGDIWYWLRSEE